ncbi:MAG TPA: glycoside hydrolase family 31 protein, partial [Candidatus Saccharicenans sp.]|nr:glycoside hydrolase family 31 protein [Candidatus Saccharicenans sp.]
MKKACLLILNFCLIFGLSSFWSQTASGQTLKVADTACQLIITPVSDYTLRITLKPYSARDNSDHLDDSPVLVRREWPAPLLIKTDLKIVPDLVWKNLKIQVKPEPLTITLSTFQGKIIQELVIDKATGAVHFLLGDKPLLGLGGGGKGLDRRGLYDPMDNGHRSAEYQIYGSRLPIPFLIGTDGWALFFHRPYNGGFDLRTNPGAFLPSQNPRGPKEKALPLDLFLIAASSPEIILAEYNGLTGKPVMPPKWALGYMQSHRTLAGPEVITEVASTFREKKLPCDALIYLGTGYCPSGWNSGHGSFEFNPATFNQPEKIINQLHQLGFKVILHVNNPPVTLHGEFPVDKTTDLPPDHIASYWEKHRPLLALGIDGWWPDDGDVLPIDSRLSRHLIYYHGPLSDRP